MTPTNEKHTNTYLIASDLHGSVSAAQQLLRYFDEGGYDKLILLGDFLNYGPRNSVPTDLDAPTLVSVLNERADRIVAVRGNCDSEVDQMLFRFNMMSDYRIVLEGGKRIFLTHGHIYGENRRPGLGIDVLLFGHTHIWRCQRQPDGLVICNPGSPTFPKAGNPPTYATLDADGVLRVRLLSDGSMLRQCAI